MVQATGRILSMQVCTVLRHCSNDSCVHPVALFDFRSNVACTPTVRIPLASALG